MAEDEDFRVRPGRIRSTAGQRGRPFIAQALAAAQKAGGPVSRSGRITAPRNSRFGRGRVASVRANRFITSRSRGAVIKTRVVRHGARAAPLSAHLDYLRRDGVTRDGEKAQMFGADREVADHQAFGERCQHDRHHFRFIVSPDDALEMSDLRTFTRDLMGRMEKDLGTKLDWVAVDHWNTEHPHIHVILRGRADDGKDLVIARDYIREGMRSRAQDIVTQELGPRTDLDIRRSLERQVEAERWTNLDRQLVRDAERGGVIDMTSKVGEQPDEYHALKIGRLRKLERLSLAEQIAPGQWSIADEAEPVLRELGERGDIIKRMHRALSERGISRATSAWVLEAETLPDLIVGRLVDRGLDDELKGTAYAVVDGTDGRTHHIRLPDLEAAGDSRPGSIVELRRFEDRRGRSRAALAVRSDMNIEAQVTAPGATWLDRRNIARDPQHLGGGFGEEVKTAMEARADHLAGEGLARRQGQRVVFARDLLDTLRRRELDVAATKLAAETGLPHLPAKTGDYVVGTVRQRLTLASGRFAMIEGFGPDGGPGFTLVPWSPSIDRQLGKHISGVMRSDGGVDWTLGRGRGMGL